MKLKGKIVSNKMDKTVVVSVSHLKKHPIYGKYMKVSKKYKAHSEKSIPEGTEVVIEPVRPLSKDKHWKILKK